MMIRLLAWPARYPRAAMLISLALVILSALAVSRVRPDASLESMMSKGDPAVAAAVRVLHEFPVAEELLVLASVPQSKGPDPDALLAFAGRLEQAIRKSPDAGPLCGEVNYRAGMQIREFFERVLVPNGLFYLDDASFEAARERLTGPRMLEQLRRSEARLAVPGPSAAAMAKVFAKDPLNLHEFVLERLTGNRPFKTYQSSDAFISEDGRSILIRIAGTRPPSDLESAKRMTATVGDLVKQGGGINTDGLEVDLSGSYAIAAASERAIRADMIESVACSVAFLALLFAVAYRRPGRLFLIGFIPLAVGVLYGFAVYSMFSTTLTPLTAVIGGILAGMGIDYCIQYLSHYELSRSLGMDSVGATVHTVESLWPAMVAAWATSIVGFVAVSSSTVQALRDFAILGSLGLTGAFVGAHFVLPALLALRDRRPAAARPSPRIDVGPALAWVRSRPRPFVIGSAAVLLAAVAVVVAKGSWLGLETNLAVMHPQPNPPLDAQLRIAQRMGGSPGSLIVYLKAASPDALTALAHRVENRLSTPAVRSVGVTGAYGLAALLPDPTIVAKRRAAIRPDDADRVVADFRAAVAQTGFEPAAFEPYVGFLRHLLTESNPPQLKDVLDRPELAKTVLARDAVAGQAPPTEAITLVFVDNPLDDAAARGRIIGTIRAALAGLDGATLTGLNVIGHDVQSTIQADLPRVTLLAIGIVLLYLFLQLRTLREPLLALVPMLVSLLLTLAVMHLAGHKLNMINLVAIPLLIGIDVDYAVFIVNAARLRKKSPPAIFEEQLASSCHAIIVCAAATFLGFGSLVFTSVPAVRSLGLAVAVGVAAALAATIFCLLPLVAPLPPPPRDDGAAKRGNPGRITGVTALLLLLFTGIGCAPDARLTFPRSPLRDADGQTWYDVDGDGKGDFALLKSSDGRINSVAYDDDADGRLDRVYHLSDYPADRVPHVIVLLDSIPFAEVAARYAAGDFRWFDPPQKIIAPFPSLTEICYTDLLHAPPLPGIIDQYYDPRTHSTHGGLWDRAGGHEEPWERRLSYHANFVEQGPSYMRPRTWHAAEMARVRHTIDESPDRVTLVYVTSASGMLCKYGREGCREVLDDVRQLCLQLLYERQGAIRISVLADHGHNLTPSTNVHLDEILTAAGFHPARAIAADRDVVVEINGLVTYAGVVTRHPAAVSDALLNRPEIELAMYVDGDAVTVRSARGAARVDCKAGVVRYRPADADVLHYQPVLDLLKAAGKIDRDGFVRDDDWFAATKDHAWPDAPRRVWDAFHGRAVNVPTVMLSLRDGSCAGLAGFEGFITMASTHGGLNQINSATFVMTMSGHVDGTLRTRDVMAALEPGFVPVLKR